MGDHDQAARRANLGVVFATVVGVILGVALWLLQEPLFRLMNAPDNLLPLIRDYMDPFALAAAVRAAACDSTSAASSVVNTNLSA